MRIKPLDLPANASKAAFVNALRGAGTGHPKGNLTADIDDIFGRTTPHQMIDSVYDPTTKITAQVPKMVSVKLNTLKVMLDNENTIIGYVYEES